jgi:hypothetical protein
MHETNDDLTALQRLLDASYARAGEHLRMIWERTRGSTRGSSATSSSASRSSTSPRSRPAVSPASPRSTASSSAATSGSARPTNSLRFRNIRANPAVSGAITRGGETFLILVHSRATETDPRGPEADGVADYVRSVYDLEATTSRSSTTTAAEPMVDDSAHHISADGLAALEAELRALETESRRAIP